ncbi:DUF2806 domain-containing protein [Butyrivibrio sp. WCD2001]|uniref:DUF2806 domain-containing protein n=1 Tax=Butyrivibrio sp. WCD2001 TaxID=1280681 RepID=UPI00040407C2|nr:DUF2806 domain-containing protein [Butyrivibrio sp. WCD2001]
METIIDGAYYSLKGIKDAKDGEISREWMHRFIDAAGDISTEDLQTIWSKVLAGEVLDPEAFSLRTLECLRNMDVRDAKLFEKLCDIAISNKFVINDMDVLEEKGLSYESILELDEAGIINSSGMIKREIHIDSDGGIVIDFGSYVLIGKSEDEKVIIINEFPLTLAGKELSAIIGGNLDLDTIKSICSVVSKRNRRTNFSLCEVECRDGEIITCSDESIPFWS